MSGLFTATKSEVFLILLFVSLIFITPHLISSKPFLEDQKAFLNENIFCFVGDTGKVTEVQKKVILSLARSDCSSIWHTGDIVYPSGINTIEDPLYSKNFLVPFKEILEKKVPIFLTLGNHDHKKNPKAYLQANNNNELVNFPNNFYRKKFGDLCFLALDTTIFDKMYMFNQRRSHIEWLNEVKELFKNSCKFSLAVGHHPFFSSGDRKKASPQLGIFLQNHIFGSFDVYISGHNHVLADEGERLGTRQLISGSGSVPGGSPNQPLSNRFNQENPGYLKFRFFLEKGEIIGRYEFVEAGTDKILWSNYKVGKGIRFNQ